MMEPSYLRLYENKELKQRIERARDILKSCELCPRTCNVNRLNGEQGFCRTGRWALVSSYNAHFGEEAPLVGQGGSGTIFFTHCNLRCSFCQNFEISHLGLGQELEAEGLARMMLELQRIGCHNINFVTPSHVVAQILEALTPAIEMGMRLPLVYNTGGYDHLETLRLLEGVVDIYMPDIKFFDSSVGERLCQAPDYPEVVKTAVKEMHHQVGDLKLDERGTAVRGLLVRHLVMPNGLSQTPQVMNFLAKDISTDTYVNVMDQFRPCGEAQNLADLSRRIAREEYHQAVEDTRKAGLHRLDSRDRTRILRIF